MIEAMACGTPVIAWPCGSVPEVMQNGVTGFLVNSVDDAVEAVHRLPTISRRECRGVFDERFCVGRMTHEYLDIYANIASSRATNKNGHWRSKRFRSLGNDYPRSEPAPRSTVPLKQGG